MLQRLDSIYLRTFIPRIPIFTYHFVVPNNTFDGSSANTNVFNLLATVADCQTASGCFRLLFFSQQIFTKHSLPAGGRALSQFAEITLVAADSGEYSEVLNNNTASCGLRIGVGSHTGCCCTTLILAESGCLRFFLTCDDDTHRQHYHQQQEHGNCICFGQTRLLLYLLPSNSVNYSSPRFKDEFIHSHPVAINGSQLQCMRLSSSATAPVCVQLRERSGTGVTERAAQIGF